jgi:hypothetical protein
VVKPVALPRQAAWLVAVTLALCGCVSASKVTVVETAPSACERIGDVGRTLCGLGEPGPGNLDELKTEARRRGGNVLHCCTTSELDAAIEGCVYPVAYAAVVYACPVPGRPQTGRVE